MSTLSQAKKVDLETRLDGILERLDRMENMTKAILQVLRDEKENRFRCFFETQEVKPKDDPL